MHVCLENYFGDKNFYKMVLTVAFPLIVQNAISTFVSLLDNVMIGQVGTLAMSAISISNQLLLIFNFAIMGSMYAIGIFSAQYYGKKDTKGFQECFRLKIYVALILSCLLTFIMLKFGNSLLSLYMNSNSNTAETIAKTIDYSSSYTKIMLIGIFPYSITVALSYSMRETGNTFIPMLSSITALLVNCLLNYCLIYGNFGFPVMGVIGAATATVIARYMEAGIILLGTMKHRNDYCDYINHVFKTFSIPFDLIKKFIKNGTPLVLNEVLWSVGLAAIYQRYSLLGLDAIAAINISDVISNVFSMALIGLGSSVSILVGQKLGGKLLDEAKDIDRKMITFAFVLNIFIALILFLLAPYLTEMFAVDENVKHLAQRFIRVTALLLPFRAIYSCSYYTLRAGGKTIITTLFDSGYTCTVALITATILTLNDGIFSQMDTFTVYLWIKLLDIPKALLGLYLIHKGIWIKNLVE